MDEYLLLDEISDRYATILGSDLVGVYVYGSVAFQCFNWDKSDINFLIAVKNPVPLEKKKQMIEMLLQESKAGPKNGFSMSVVLEKYCRRFVYPTPYELRFAARYEAIAREDLDAYCLAAGGVDRDLAFDFGIAKRCGVTLRGKNIAEVFGPIPKRAIIAGLKYKLKKIGNEAEARPIDVVLNLCRAVAYLREDKILSKEEGGKWGIERLPEVFVPLARRALAAYTSNDSFAVDKATLKRFVEYMTDLILA